MTKTLNNDDKRRAFWIRTLADPVLIYTVIAMTAIMNHYRSVLVIPYGIAAYVLGWLVFRAFDYINKHHVIGTFVYIAIASLFIVTSVKMIAIGSVDYPIVFGLWFLTPIEVMQYNKWYTLAIFLLFLIFMLSVIYYFTRVRYRMFMNFLILIIPFAIYGKENEEMELGFIIALCVGYVLILANFRQLSDSKDAVVVDKPEAWKSAAVFTVLFALVSALIPKPAVEADRTMIETMINADALTDRFLEMLNIFRDDTSGQQFRGTTNDTPLYYVNAKEPMHFKTATFTKYDHNNDTWNASYEDSFTEPAEEYPIPLYYCGGVSEAVAFAAAVDGDFAEKYGISELVDMDVLGLQRQVVTIYSNNKGGNSVPVPQGAITFHSTDFEGKLGSTSTGLVLSESTRRLKGKEQFMFYYMPEGYFLAGDNEKSVSLIAEAADYTGMLEEAYNILGTYTDIITDDHKFVNTIENYRSVLSANISAYASIDSKLLDYNGDQRLLELAEKITDGAETEYEKAKALEWYFINNKFTYDTEYQKAPGENVDDFLFRTKRGVCYEYATAMTLMARAVGIPARYCEGFSMQNLLNPAIADTYVITAKNAHGFPELYIKGYGWMTFEPTMTNDDNGVKRSITDMLMQSGVILLIISALALVLILLFPKISHRFFLMTNGHRSPDEAVRAVIHRICRLYGVSAAATVHEAANAVKTRSGCDISETALIFEKAVYGGVELNEGDRTRAIEEYVSAYNALCETKKAERKARKKDRKKRA